MKKTLKHHLNHSRCGHNKLSKVCKKGNDKQKEWKKVKKDKRQIKKK